MASQMCRSFCLARVYFYSLKGVGRMSYSTVSTRFLFISLPFTA